MQSSHDKTLQTISHQALIELLLEILLPVVRKGRQFPSKFDWKAKLHEMGYLPEFRNIDFAKVDEELGIHGIKARHRAAVKKSAVFADFKFNDCKNVWDFVDGCLFNQCQFERCTMQGFRGSKLQDCTFNEVHFTNATIGFCRLENVAMTNCHFINCDVKMLNVANFQLTGCNIEDSRWAVIDGDFSPRQYRANKVDAKSFFNDTSWEFMHQHASGRPIVVLLYAPVDGVNNTDKLVEFFRNKNLDLKLINPKTGMKHPVFNTPELISGIILPGGPDVPPGNKDPRKKFELALVDLAREKRIPMLGICRGHQLIGSLFGGLIMNNEDHQKHVIVVKPKQGSLLYEKLKIVEEKLAVKNCQNESEVKSSLHKDSEQQYTYHSNCMHHQVLLFDAKRDKNRVKITARALDRTPEALQIDDHIITYQHHHESVVGDPNPVWAALAKKVLNQFAKMVKHFDVNYRRTSSEEEADSPRLNNS